MKGPNLYQKQQQKNLIRLRGQRVKATLDAAEKEWAIICSEANALGVNLDRYGNMVAMDNFRKHAWEMINFRKMSRFLAGGDFNITRTIIPKIYAREVFDIVKSVEQMLRNVKKRRYEKVMRKKREVQNKRIEKRNKARIRNKVDKFNLSK